MAVAHRPLLAKLEDGMAASISRYGATAAMAALLTVVASGYLAIGGHHCPLPMLVAFYAAGTAEIVLLCRTVVPSWLQGILILLLIASLTTLTARTDVFGIERTNAAIPGVPEPPIEREAGAKQSGEAPRAPASAAADGSIAANGAQVVFQSAHSGDDGWAKLLNAAYDRHLGGPQASRLIISGNVGAKRIGKDMNVEVNWGVSTAGTSVRCGSTSAYGSDYPALSDQIRQGIGQAIARSIELQRPSCQ